MNSHLVDNNSSSPSAPSTAAEWRLRCNYQIMQELLQNIYSEPVADYYYANLRVGFLLPQGVTSFSLCVGVIPTKWGNHSSTMDYSVWIILPPTITHISCRVCALLNFESFFLWFPPTSEYPNKSPVAMDGGAFLTRNDIFLSCSLLNYLCICGTILNLCAFIATLSLHFVRPCGGEEDMYIPLCTRCHL